MIPHQFPAARPLPQKLNKETKPQLVRRRLKRFKQRVVVLESKIALVKKRERSAEANGKYLLGKLADIADWELMSFVEADKKIASIANEISTSPDTSSFRDLGIDLFEKHKLSKIDKRDSYIDAESAAYEIHYRITLGGMWIKYGMGAERKAVILGAMYVFR